MAEANARPVLPVSTKAASIVAAAGGSSAANAQQAGAGRQLALRAPQSQTTCSIEQRRQQQQHRPANADRNSPRAPDQSGPARPQALPHLAEGPALAGANEQPAPDTLASNLRKMIVSSSASLSRKFNITSSGSISALTGQSLLKNRPTSSIANEKQQSNLALDSSTRHKSSSTSVPAAQPDKKGAEQDFEARQASYQHPVIRPCVDRTDSIQSQPEQARPVGDTCSQLADEPINVSSGDCTGAYLDSSDSERTSVDGCQSLASYNASKVNQPRIGVVSEIAPKRLVRVSMHGQW